MATRKLPPPTGQSAAAQAKNWLTGEPILAQNPAQPQQNTLQNLQGIDLSTYEPAQLLELRALIDTFLPIRSLKNVNMEQELVIQLLTAQKLQSDTLASEETPANQKSQVVNSVAGALATLAKLQVELFDSERLKTIEACLIEAINTLPTETQETFFTKYESLLGGVL